jgi:uncharacterized OB-fold protein
MTAGAPPTIDTRPPRNCIKCGREIGPDESICEVCNRAGMATPSATQYHGTIVVAIVAGVALMAIAASLGLRGVGPFTGSEVAVRLGTQGTVVATVRIANEGTKAGRATCQLTAHDAAGHTLGVATTITGEIAGGRSLTYDELIPGVDGLPASVTVRCQ